MRNPASRRARAAPRLAVSVPARRSPPWRSGAPSCASLLVTRTTSTGRSTASSAQRGRHLPMPPRRHLPVPHRRAEGVRRCCNGCVLPRDARLPARATAHCAREHPRAAPRHGRCNPAGTCHARVFLLELPIPLTLGGGQGTAHCAHAPSPWRVGRSGHCLSDALKHMVAARRLRRCPTASARRSTPW